jgi:hypothetical protein
MARSRTPSAPPKPPPAPTDLNLFAQEDALAEAPDGIIRKVAPTEKPHLKRCLAAGLLEAAPGEENAWRLSAAGTSALAARRVRNPSGFAGYRSQFLTRDLLVQTMALAVAAGTLSSTESVVFLFCWDRPSTIADALATLGMPRVFAEALKPGVFTVGPAPESFTLEGLLKAHSARMMPADVTAIAALAPGEAHELRLGGGGVLVRRVGAPPREACSPSPAGSPTSSRSTGRCSARPPREAPRDPRR